MRNPRVTLKLSIVVMCLIVAMSFTLLGCGKKQVDESKTPYKIGVVLSATGGNAPLGTAEKNSLMMLEKQINDEGGVEGHAVRFIIEDDESDPAKASVAVNKLIKQDNVIAVIGSSGTGPTLAMVPVCEKEQIAQVCMAAGTKITHPVNKWVFRTPPSDSMAIDRVLAYLKDDLKVKKIAVLHDANAFGTGGADELAQKAPAAGIEIVARESYGSADTDMTAQLTKIKDTPAEALVVWGTNPGPAIIAKNMQQLGMKIPYIGSHGIANKKFIELAGPAAEGVVFPAGKLLVPDSITDPDWKAAVEKFAADFKAAYNLDIDTFAAHGYDAGNIIFEALKRDASDKAAVRDQIEKTKDFIGVDGSYTYSPTDHDGLNVDDLIMIKVVNGAWTQAKSS